ncbi:MAG: hypothetical protein M3292_01535 [Actinomycetota bacterium]|nr:hypothetical protein [Actinomycetota bacterium]
MTTAICVHGPCGTSVECGDSSSCSIICSDDCTLCVIKCGESLGLVEETPWLLKAEKLTFAGSNLEPAFLADYLGRLLGTTLTAKPDSAARVNVSEFTGTIEELLDHVGLRAEGYLRR